MGLFSRWQENRKLKIQKKFEYKTDKLGVKNNRIDSKENAKVTAYEKGIVPGMPWAQALSNIGTTGLSAFGKNEGAHASGGISAMFGTGTGKGKGILIIGALVAVALLFKKKK
jgi:hypothetical protein